jgi:hypothetical protein
VKPSGPRVDTGRSRHRDRWVERDRKAFAHLAVERGARVSVLALANQDLETTVAELDTAGVTCRAVGLDVADRNAVSGGVALATGGLGPGVTFS